MTFLKQLSDTEKQNLQKHNAYLQKMMKNFGFNQKLQDQIVKNEGYILNGMEVTSENDK